MLDFESGNTWETLQKNVVQNIKIQKEKKDYNDPRVWKITKDENDRGSALIRLLPDPENVPYVVLYNHSFSSYDPTKKKARWFIENSPETIKLPSPASELWSALFNYKENPEKGKAESKAFNRKISYFSNIKVLKDPGNPQNNGSIKIWSYGTRMFEKFLAANEPTKEELELGVKPKDLWNPIKGNSVLLKTKMGSNKIPTFDDTTIEESSSIYKSNAEGVNDIMTNGHKLNELISPEAFTSYEELVDKMLWVLETYNPQFLDKLTFDKIVFETFGRYPGSKNSPQNATQNVTQKPKVETPVVKETTEKEVEQVIETPSVVSKPKVVVEDDSSDLDFLNELDNL